MRNALLTIMAVVLVVWLLNLFGILQWGRVVFWMLLIGAAALGLATLAVAGLLRVFVR